MATIPLRGLHSVSLKQCTHHISGVANQFATTSSAHTNRKTTKVAAYSDESPSIVNGFARKCTSSQLSVARPVVSRGATVVFIIKAASSLTSVSSLLPHPACSLYCSNPAHLLRRRTWRRSSKERIRPRCRKALSTPPRNHPVITRTEISNRKKHD
jgi:hypothetical protein